MWSAGIGWAFAGCGRPASDQRGPCDEELIDNGAEDGDAEGYVERCRSLGVAGRVAQPDLGAHQYHDADGDDAKRSALVFHPRDDGDRDRDREGGIAERGVNSYAPVTEDVLPCDHRLSSNENDQAHGAEAMKGDPHMRMCSTGSHGVGIGGASVGPVQIDGGPGVTRQRQRRAGHCVRGGDGGDMLTGQTIAHVG